jgi:DNA modification methylase
MIDNWAKIIFADSRSMMELDDQSIDLVVTSPPYWHIKDYGVPGQIGYGQSLHEYLIDLYRTWSECFRVLRDGSRLCINIGDQFARSSIYGRYKVIPLHAEFISQCELIGFDFLGAVIWQKKTTMNPSGGANVMGSYPYPPNGLVEIDYEFILIFKKPGKGRAVSKEIKEASKLTKEEWKEYYSGHWRFGGAKQASHEAMFPEELPKRLIRMFTFVGDTVLDPFLGSGTTVKAALELGRNGVGYEIHQDFLGLIQEKLGMKDRLPVFPEIAITSRKKTPRLPPPSYQPRLPDARPLGEVPESGPELHKVVAIVAPDTLKIDTGRCIKFLGVRVTEKDKALAYLYDKILGKSIICKVPDGAPQQGDPIPAYVYLKNRIFVNKYLLAAGLGAPDLEVEHKFKKKFLKVWEDYQAG